MLLEDADRAQRQQESSMFKRKLIQAVSGFVRGPFQAHLFEKFGFIGALPAVFGFIGLSAIANHFEAKDKLDELTNTYRDDLATMLGQPRGTITFHHLQRAAQNLPANNPIRMDYESIRSTARTRQWKSVFKNLTISAAVIGFAALSVVGITGSVAGMIAFTVIGAMSMTIDLVAENMFSKWEQKKTITGVTFVNQVTAELSKGPVTPAKLMEFSAQTNPRIKAAIHEAFRSDYATLNFQQKQEAIAMLGQGPFLSAIAQDLNEGRIRPSELPFLLSGLDSPSTPIRRYTLPPSPAAPTRAAEPLALAPSHHIHEAEPHGAVSTLTPARVLH